MRFYLYATGFVLLWAVLVVVLVPIISLIVLGYSIKTRLLLWLGKRRVCPWCGGRGTGCPDCVYRGHVAP